MKHISTKVIDFLIDLSKNNNREWFHEHKKEYQAAKKDFELFVTEVLEALSPYEDLGDLKPKDVSFRIFRDVRFSADKTPYKVSMSTSFSKGGRKSPYHPFYMHIEPTGRSFVGGGSWAPSGEQLAKLRQEVDYNAEELKGILSAPDFKKYFGALQGEKLKTNPRSYPADHPEIELLRHKQMVVMRELDRNLLSSDALIDELVLLYRTIQPLLRFLDYVLVDELKEET